MMSLDFLPDEQVVLADPYPVTKGYRYLVDGVMAICPVAGTVADWKAAIGRPVEIRRYDTRRWREKTAPELKVGEKVNEKSPSGAAVPQG